MSGKIQSNKTNNLLFLKLCELDLPENTPVLIENGKLSTTCKWASYDGSGVVVVRNKARKSSGVSFILMPGEMSCRLLKSDGTYFAYDFKNKRDETAYSKKILKQLPSIDEN